ncbi:MAG: transporter substrate-binding protein, partial [Rhodospirillales bacterium]|nr:transporter substrate-binding protein [Rhodospirillales bacterium]
MTSSKFLSVAILAAAALSASPALAQKSKDTLRYPLSESETALDPYLLPGPFNNGWELSVWDALLSFDSKGVKFAPLVAKSWSQPDETTYDFELRDDITWHDGQKLNADDVVYTIKYITDPKVNLRYKSNWTWIASVEKLSDHKVRIKSKRPVPDGMMWMAYTSIYPEHIHGPMADKQAFGAKPVGTGPLKIARIDKNTGIVAGKNSAFRTTGAKQAATIGRFVSEPVPDAGTLVAKILTGGVDLARDVPADAVTSLKDSGQFEFTLAPETLAYTFIGFPTAGASNVKALGDVRVRQAILKAIDRKQLV